MIKLNPYLNFMGRTEEAFDFYKSVFGGEFVTLQRFRDVPGLPGADKMSEDDSKKLMHVALKVGDNTLMGTDALESMGHTLTVGNNISLSLHPETREELERLFAGLAEGGTIVQPLEKAPWGATFGMLDDKFGIKWMFNFEEKE